ncbi:MAG: Sec-independent protein translocase subunit TatA/TatB [Solirubrobacterales bacterium]
MPGNIGLPEIAIVLVIVLIIFGPKRLPELGQSLGRGIREFKGSLGGDHDDKPIVTELDEGDKSKAAEPTVTATPVDSEKPRETSAGS